MKTVFTLTDLIPEHFFGVAELFLITYIGRYDGNNISKRCEVFEVSCSIDPNGDFWSRPIRFVSDGTSQHWLAKKLTDKWVKVSHVNLPSHIGGWAKLLYRDIKDLPRLKLEEW